METDLLASFSGLCHGPVFNHFQYAKTEGEGLGDLVTCRWGEGGGMPNKESQGPSCKILSKDLRPECSKYRLATAMFVSY